MSPTDIDSLPFQQLIDLLVKNTMELIELTEKRGMDRNIIVNKRSDVRIIQSAIENKMRVKSQPLLLDMAGTPNQLN